MVRTSANKCPPVIPAYYKSLTWPNQPCAGDGDDDGFDDGEEEEDDGYCINSNLEFFDLMSFKRIRSNNIGDIYHHFAE